MPGKVIDNKGQREVRTVPLKNKLNHKRPLKSDSKQRLEETAPLLEKFKAFVNNRYILVILGMILVCILILLLRQLGSLLTPVWQFLQTVTLPVILAGVLYYLTVPIVNRLEKHHISRKWGAWLVLLLLVIVIILFSAWVPSIVQEAKRFFSNWDTIWYQYQDQIAYLIPSQWITNLQFNLEHFLNYLESINWNWGQFFNSTVSSLTSILGVVARVMISLVTAPILLFYMLKDGQKFQQNLAIFIPSAIREKTLRMLGDMNAQIAAYVRGQILVAFAVAIMFIIGYQIIGLEYGLIIGFSAGILNVIPYVGSFLAMIPALIVGIVHSPWQFVQVLMVFAVEQTLESRLISPLVLGSNLNIHPVTIMLLLIAAGDMWGVAGIVFVIPIYAVLKVVFFYVFDWYRSVSGLYEEEAISESLDMMDNNTDDTTKDTQE
ncbi:MAG: AI-2E family transporter [Aerococcus sp.]|nr:AI-2E family transporter [Aerococcus sp.]